MKQETIGNEPKIVGNEPKNWTQLFEKIIDFDYGKSLKVYMKVSCDVPF